MIGYLYTGAAEPTAHLLAAFRKGLSDTGYVEGHNVAIEYRWAEKIKAIDCQNWWPTCGPPSGGGHQWYRLARSRPLPLKTATTTIPIVFGTGTDPVQIGLVASFDRQGGHLARVSAP